MTTGSKRQKEHGNENENHHELECDEEPESHDETQQQVLGAS